jgi:hypothetical protein
MVYAVRACAQRAKKNCSGSVTLLALSLAPGPKTISFGVVTTVCFVRDL